MKLAFMASKSLWSRWTPDSKEQRDCRPQICLHWNRIDPVSLRTLLHEPSFSPVRSFWKQPWVNFKSWNEDCRRSVSRSISRAPCVQLFAIVLAMAALDTILCSKPVKLAATEDGEPRLQMSNNIQTTTSFIIPVCLLKSSERARDTGQLQQSKVLFTILLAKVQHCNHLWQIDNARFLGDTVFQLVRWTSPETRAELRIRKSGGSEFSDAHLGDLQPTYAWFRFRNPDCGSVGLTPLMSFGLLGLFP